MPDSDQPRAYSSGGLVCGFLPTLHVERAGNCPSGHPWYRIDGSPYVEHVARADEVHILDCPYRVYYQPEADDA